jgi:DNA-binding LytR/AlgR family response regulator
MPTAVIADDEPLMRASLREQLHQLWPQLEVLAEAGDGPAALVAIESLRPDIAFVDIRMPGLSGLQVAHGLTVPTKVIFVTAYESHAVEAFEANAVDYVLKPVDTARLAKVVGKLKKSADVGQPLPVAQLVAALERLQVGGSDTGQATRPQARLDWVHMAVGKHVQLVNIDDVMYFESDTKYTRVVTAQAEGWISTPLKELLEQLDGSAFLQIHRSRIVNRHHVHAVHRHDNVVELQLRGRSERLSVSTANHHLFKAT